MMKNRRIAGGAALAVLLFVLGLAAPAASAQRRERPAELVEYQTAMRIQDLAARVKELERIKAAYPTSQYRPLIESGILYAKIQMAESVDEVLKLHEAVIRGAEGLNRIFVFYSFSWDILRHPNGARFDRARATAAVLDYVARGLKLADDPEFQKSVAAEERSLIEANRPVFYLAEAAAHLNAGDSSEASAALDKFVKGGHDLDMVYRYVRGDLDLALGREKEALESYIAAAAQNYGDALAKARTLYQKLRGTLDGFESRLDDERKKLPYTPAKFTLQGAWTGKTVLAELFTGSECPPCVASDLGFDGLLEAFEDKYLAVLEYHVPIPRPDPMMNQATRKRLQAYGVTSTPSTFFDGEAKAGGGGNRSMAGEKFREFAAEVRGRLAEKPSVRLTVIASRSGDVVRVDMTAAAVPAGADVNAALVQDEEEYAGSNGIILHKMVVRDFITLSEDEVKAGRASFDIKAAEAAAAERLAEVERQTSYRFPEKKNAIDRTKLRVVVFVQDRASRKIYNAATAAVRSQEFRQRP